MEDKKTEYNILLLGETGVGKSTLINSIINYVHYNSLEEAEENETFVIIPTKFNISDVNGEYHEVYAGKNTDCNECLEVGASASQSVKSYIIPIDPNTSIRLIDCPGIGDTRGIERDDKNCENILSYIAHLEDLHGICLLFAPTNSRIHVFFEYCIKQILSRLEKSAVDNIMFIFTNTRGTNFTPGETHSCIKKVVDDLKNKPPFVEIPYSKENIFCFDNETFRYLCAVNQGIEFGEFATFNAKMSWRNSTDEWLKLLIRIADNENPLKPHKTKKTISINEARKLIVYLSRPLSDISEYIQKYLIILNRHDNDLNKENQTLGQLKQKLYIPIISLQIKELKQPVTVCTNKKCSEVIKVNSIDRWHYKQQCHNPCYLKNVPTELVGSPELLSCAAINAKGKCNNCECDYTCHMHILYETDVVDDKICDKNIVKQIKSKEEAMQAAQKLSNDMRTLQKEYIEERDKVTQITAEFSCFLQTNAICQFNDTYEKYISYLIDREESLGDEKNSDMLKRYKSLLAQYLEIRHSLESAEKLRSETKSNVAANQLTPDYIMGRITTLYNLKHTGSKIKKMYQCYLTLGQTSFDKKNTEIVKPLPQDNWFQKACKKGKKALLHSENRTEKANKGLTKEQKNKAKHIVGDCASSAILSEQDTSVNHDQEESITSEIEHGLKVAELEDSDEHIVGDCASSAIVPEQDTSVNHNKEESITSEIEHGLKVAELEDTNEDVFN